MQKRSGQELRKTGLVEKDVKSNGWLMPPVLICLKVLAMMNSLQNIVISGAQGLPGADLRFSEGGAKLSSGSLKQGVWGAHPQTL